MFNKFLVTKRFRVAQEVLGRLYKEPWAHSNPHYNNERAWEEKDRIGQEEKKREREKEKRRERERESLSSSCGLPSEEKEGSIGSAPSP